MDADALGIDDPESYLGQLARQLLNGLLLAGAVHLLLKNWHSKLRGGQQPVAAGGSEPPAQAQQQQQPAPRDEDMAAFAEAAIQAQAMSVVHGAGRAAGHSSLRSAPQPTAGASAPLEVEGVRERSRSPRAPRSAQAGKAQGPVDGASGQLGGGVPALPRRRAPSARRRAAARAAAAGLQTGVVGAGASEPRTRPAPLVRRPVSRTFACSPQRTFAALCSAGFQAAWHEQARSTQLRVGQWCRAAPKDTALLALYAGASNSPPARWRRVRFTHAPNALLMRGEVEALELQMVVHHDVATGGGGVLEVCQVNNEGGSAGPRLVVWQQIAVAPVEGEVDKCVVDVSWRVEWKRPPPRLLRPWTNAALDRLLRHFTGKYALVLEAHALEGHPVSRPPSRVTSRASVVSTASDEAAPRPRPRLLRLAGALLKAAALAAAGTAVYHFARHRPVHHQLQPVASEDAAATSSSSEKRQNALAREAEQTKQQARRGAIASGKESGTGGEGARATEARASARKDKKVAAMVATAQSEASAQMEWKSAVDPSSGQTYYYNSEGATQWTPPPGWAS